MTFSPEPPPDPRSFLSLAGDSVSFEDTPTSGAGPEGRLPLTSDLLSSRPSGDLFGLTQNAGMGWEAARTNDPPYLIVSTQGGLPGASGPEALGYHTGHWELLELVRRAAETIRQAGGIPFAAYCTDPCDGRSQGTPGMMDSLAYRNDAAIVVRRLIRSLPRRRGVLAIATCDKGLPAMLMAVAGCPDLPAVVVPGGVTLPARDAEDAGTVQTIGARFAHGLISLEYAADVGCRACGSSGGGCQFLGTAASSQVAAEALGLALPHSALCPSGTEPWIELAARSAHALMAAAGAGLTTRALLGDSALENALVVHAAFGGSTNMLLHLPAIAHAAGLRLPGLDDWRRIHRSVPRLVDALPNGPRNHPTVQVYLAGGVPEVMLHLRRLGLLDPSVPTLCGRPLGEVLDWWEQSPRRASARRRLAADGIDPDLVILEPDRARQAGLTPTTVFPGGNLAPEGAVVKATAIAPEVTGPDGVYRLCGPARVFTSEPAAVEAIKTSRIKPGDVLVLAGIGPLGTGMEETYQVTSALKFIPWGKSVAVVTDGRFSGVSTGACIGHVSPEGLAGGPIGRLRDGDLVEIVIDRVRLEGSVNLVGTAEGRLDPVQASRLLASRPPHPGLQPNPHLPDDTRLWAALQQAGGGIWRGAVYDVDRICEALNRMQTAGSSGRPVDPENSQPPESSSSDGTA
jgi:putative YjhG/YagF family dehydratase